METKIENKKEAKIEDFLENTTLIHYNRNECSKSKIDNINKLIPIQNNNFTQWFNTYGSVKQEDLKEIINKNNLDDFLIKLLAGKYTNKVIELDNILFVSIEVFREDNYESNTEKIAFILNTNFIWSIQEKLGDYFGGIRKRLNNGKIGAIHNKKADYLFFLMLDSIVSNYEKKFQKMAEHNNQLLANSKIKPTPYFTSVIENHKQEILKLNKSTKALRDTITKLEKTKIPAFNTKYFDALKEQTMNLVSDIDFEIQELESKINLIFSIQGHHLNEVMKTLTIFSIIFTPITFIVGLYGMNFKNMPELYFKYGYFGVLALMIIITVVVIIYLKRKKWF